MLSNQRLPKHSIPVRVSMINNVQLLGVVYVHHDQRILDLLCDNRSFFPIRTKSGLSLLNKNSVAQVEVFTMEDTLDKQELFPEFDLAYLKNISR